jgi:hypothetical protein
MESVTRTSSLRSAFALLLLVVAVPAATRVWSIHSLFLDKPLRQSVQRELEAIAKEHGWNVSSLEVTQANAYGMTVQVREYRRGEDPRTCLRSDFLHRTVTPCDLN